MNVTAAILGGAGVAALAALNAAAAVLVFRRAAAKLPAPASPPVPGNTPGAGPIPVDPAPGLTTSELRRLQNIDRWAQGCDPVRRQSAEMLADTFRGAFPWLADDDLGRVLLQVSEVALAYASTGTAGRLPGTFRLAAAELTRLTRTEEVPFDQH